MTEPYLVPASELNSLPRKATLAEEIAFLRLRIRELALSQDAANDRQLLQMLALLTRMVGLQAKLGEDGPSELALIAEKARQRLVAAGLMKDDGDS